MPRARKDIVDPSSTPYYHCTSTCVRQMYLCGYDKISGKNFEYRRQWIVDRIKHLAKHFTIGVCAYAIMHNHYHIILKLGDSTTLTNSEVIQRWTSVYKGHNTIIKRFISGTASASDRSMAMKIIATWRERLNNLSWFMRALNEPIAKKANKESGHKGHFWDSRFHSQALLDDFAVLGCMAYVDLNPIRARISESLDSSDFTSIQQRIRAYVSAGKAEKAKTSNRKQRLNTQTPNEQSHFLLPMSNKQGDKAIPFSLKEYINLVQWSGQHIHPKKRGHLSKDRPNLIKQLQISQELWQQLSLNFEKGYFSRRYKVNKAKFLIF